MRTVPVRHLVALGCLLGTLGAVSIPAPRGPAPPSARHATAFALFTGSRTLVLNVNRVQCALTDYGNHCVNPNGSPVLGGGFWPRGTSDGYIYQGGLQVAAIVPPAAGFKWAGDTVGAFFVNLGGVQRHGDAVTGLFDSRRAGDWLGWPAAGIANDTSLFDPSLIGTTAVSEQDTWVRYWDGARRGTGRKHMMGIVVDQRTLAWNRPWANRDIVYLIFRLINVTSRDPAAYAGLTAAGYSSEDIARFADLGQQFQVAAQQQDQALRLPAGGLTFSNLYVGYVQDPDVGNAGFDNSTAVLPFGMGLAYKSDFSEPAWAYPPDAFGPPFARAPGFAGVQLLRGISDSSIAGSGGLWVWSNLCGACGLPDPIDVSQLYRYLSGQPITFPGGVGCTMNPAVYHVCLAVPAPGDTRYFESTGPINLGPGQSAVVVFALAFAAPVATEPAAGSGIFALPPFSLAPFVTPGVGTMTPGIPATAETLAVVGASKVRNIERAAGWASFSDANGNGRIEPNEVQAVRYSLLHKAQVARAIVAGKFVVPRPPETPNYFLIPGDGDVTVAWQKSPSERIGDPYFAVAANPLSPLYDPDYRQFDVEGYRIWRGRSSTDLRVIAQFDYGGTTLTDYTGEAVVSSLCAPELGVVSGCPAFPYKPPLAGNVVQVPPGGRVALADGSVLVLRTDTAVTGAGSGYPPLTDNGVPFVFEDRGLQNGFTYFYAVSAFDVNSIASAPSSLESPLVIKAVTPRVPSGQESGGGLGVVRLFSQGGVPLPQTKPPVLDPQTGMFSGPMPPADGLGLSLLSFLPQVVLSGTVSVTVDSIVPGAALAGVAGAYWLTLVTPAGGTAKVAIPILPDPTRSNVRAESAFAAVRYDAARAARFGGDSTYAARASVSLSVPGVWRLTSYGRADLNSDPPASSFNGPRWWSGAPNENTGNPNGGVCAPATGNCGSFTPVPDIGLSAGSLTGVTTLFHIQAYSTVPNVPMRDLEAVTSFVTRAADFAWYWGSNGAVDSVVDVTHRLRVPFNGKIRASWGVLNDSSFVNTAQLATPDQNNALLTWMDIFCVDPAPALLGQCGGSGTTPALLMDHARLSPVAAKSSAFGVTTLTSTGSGFTIYLNGHWFLMQTPSLPAAGTVWRARFYAGVIVGSLLQGFSFYPAVRPPAVPGLKAQADFAGSQLTVRTNDTVFSRIHTVPDPYYFSSEFESTALDRQLRFVNLPERAVIRIYSASGILIALLYHNDPAGGGEEPWDLRSRNGRVVATGVYFYHVEAADGRTRVGRFTIVNRR